MSKLLILQATPWKESDLLIRALSPIQGTGTYKLKHVRGKTQSRLSLAEPGSIISAQLYTRSEIPVITEGKVTERFAHVLKTLTSVNYYWFCLFALNSLVPPNSLSVAEHQHLFKEVRRTITQYNEMLQTLSAQQSGDPNHPVHRYPLALIAYVCATLGLPLTFSLRSRTPQQLFDLLVKFIENSTNRRYHTIQL